MQIMFVDDEARILAGIERALMMLDTAWECRFATSGHDALEMLTQTPADVVVSDMRMPFMDGAEFLTQVRNRWPATIRIILSGYSDADATARMLDVAHRFVAKPCDSAALLEMVGNALVLRDTFKDPDVVAMIGRVNQLPPAPKILTELGSILANPASDTRQISLLLSSDPALSARILQLANSAWFTRGAKVNDISNAISRLGLEQVRILVLASQIFANAKQDPYVDKLQHKALTAATLASRIAGGEGMASTAALLANIARLVPELRPSDKETEASPGYASLYAATGAYMLSLWGLPVDIVDAVANHVAPSGSAEKTFGTLGVVHVAVTLANQGTLDMAYLERVGVLNRLSGWQEMLAHIQDTIDE